MPLLLWLVVWECSAIKWFLHPYKSKQRKGYNIATGKFIRQIISRIIISTQLITSFFHRGSEKCERSPFVNLLKGVLCITHIFYALFQLPSSGILFRRKSVIVINPNGKDVCLPSHVKRGFLVMVLMHRRKKDTQNFSR